MVRGSIASSTWLIRSRAFATTSRKNMVAPARIAGILANDAP